MQLVRQGAAGMAMNRVGDSHQTAIPHRVTQIGRAKMPLAKTRGERRHDELRIGGRSLASLPSFARRMTTAFRRDQFETVTEPIVVSQTQTERKRPAFDAVPPLRDETEKITKRNAEQFAN